jgi:hypothetical protein
MITGRGAPFDRVVGLELAHSIREALDTARAQADVTSPVNT